MLTLPIVTLAEVKQLLELRPENTNRDAMLRRYIQVATEDLENATGRCFAKQAITEFLTSRDNQRVDYDFSGSSDYFTGEIDINAGLRTIVQPQSLPLRGVSVDIEQPLSLWYDPRFVYGDDTLVDPESYEIDTENDKLLVSTATRFRMRAFKVSYTAGYVAALENPDAPESEDNPMCLSASAPQFLKMACLLQVQFMNRKFKTDNIGMTAERTMSAKERVIQAQFATQGGIIPEAALMVSRLKRAQTGRG